MACPSGTATGRSFSHPLRVLVNRAARVRLPSSRFHHLSSQRRSMATREYRSRVRAQRRQQALDYISAFWLSVCCYLICSQEEFKPGYVNYDPLYLVCMYSHSLVSHSIFFFVLQASPWSTLNTMPLYLALSPVWRLASFELCISFIRLDFHLRRVISFIMFTNF